MGSEAGPAVSPREESPSWLPSAVCFPGHTIHLNVLQGHLKKIKTGNMSINLRDFPNSCLNMPHEAAGTLEATRHYHLQLKKLEP